MSRLRELRLHGFKSFADSTRFVFERGVNAVIGPNGSGKSNMADAVRWVLGEQSNRSLRTRRSDDVIFAGSEQRRPQGMAEAILTLDNADGWLPIEFAEVTIGRRAYRSGESEYLLNGARVRLRDISELLGEGRLGASELVVVGQGTVDAALSLRPDERRQLFEEAAGVKSLQVRKNEALSRLAKASDNLTRVNDLISELRPQVRRLSLQAKHAQEHELLARRARRLVVEWHLRRERIERAALGEARRQAAAAEAELEAVRSDLTAGRQAVAAAEERYWTAEEAARAAATSHEQAREALIRIESRLDGLRARRAEQVAARHRAERELAELDAAMDEPHEQLDPELAERLTQAADAQRHWEAAIQALADGDERLLAAEEALAEHRRQQAERIAAETRRSEELAAATARRHRLEEELTALDALAGEQEAARARSAAEEASAAQERDMVRGALADLEANRQSAEPEAVAARTAAARLAERIGALRGELEALTERAERGGRLGSLLAAAGWATLLDELDVPGALWPAIEAAIGGELGQALIWRDDEAASRLAEARGAARLLVAGRPADDEGRADALGAVGAERTLAEWIGADRLPALFHRVAVAPDLRSLLAGWRGLPPGWAAVTPTGDLADGRGLLSLRGSGEAPASEAARQHARRRELTELLARLEAEQEEARGTAARAMARVNELGREQEAARARLGAAERAARAAGVEREGAQTRLRQLAQRRSNLEGELAAVRAALEGGDASVVSQSAGGSRAGLEATVAEVRAERERLVAVRDAARAAWQAARDAAAEHEARSAGQRERRLVRDARRAHLEAGLPGLRAALERIETEEAAAERQLGAARDADSAAAQRRAQAEAERERQRTELLKLERGSGSASARLAELEAAAQAAAVAVTRHEEALAALGRERMLAIDALPEVAMGANEPEAVRDVDVAHEGDTADVSGLADDELDQELRRVRRTLAQLGSVNPFAVEEHRDLAERLDGLTAQDEDLRRAIGGTEELIARLDDEITDRFNAAFVAIGQRFDEFVKVLFAGGSASLRLAAGGDGEAAGGIEIVVQPPGKRLQRLAMLSGGERALTGVALLFAMLSVNPVPFCILDEVDAALDEANIGRFAAALRRLAETIDFVVITHNRATIEIADTIYGVTMTDAAVSRVLSLRLTDVPVEVGA